MKSLLSTIGLFTLIIGSHAAESPAASKPNVIRRFQHASVAIAVWIENTSFGEFQPRHFVGRLLSFSCAAGLIVNEIHKPRRFNPRTFFS
jgi:hypothetical protein